MLSDYARDAVIDHVLGTTSFTMPTTVWVRLHVGDPSSDGSTNGASNGTRKQATMGSAVAGTASNSGNISWSASETADERLTAVSIWDAETGGNCLIYGGLASPVVTAAGSAFSFPATNLSVSTTS